MERDPQLALALQVISVLRRHEVPFALIGATALAIHGHARATFDVDFLVTTRKVFDLPWNADIPEAVADVRKGEFDDPVAGVVRFSSANAAPVDVVLAKWKWEAEVVDRSVETPFAGERVPVPSPADLALLKVSAGGPQDLADAYQLARYDDGVVVGLRELMPALPERLAADVARFIGQFG